MIPINARHLLTKYHKRVSNDVLIPFCVVYGTRRFMHKIGDKVPINYVKDGKDPVIKDDKDYPDWVFKLNRKLPTKNELMKKLETEGLDSMTLSDKKRLKRLVTLDEIRTNNLLASTGGS